MNPTQIKCFLVVTLLAIVGFGPLSLTCLIGMTLVLTRPPWFYAVVAELYRDVAGRAMTIAAHPASKNSGVIRIKTFFWLTVLLILDIAPVPVTGSIALYVVLARPAWFRDLADKIYGA